MSKQEEEKQELTQEQVERAVEKLQAFYDSLPQDEKMVLESVLSMAESAEVTGHTGDILAPIIVGSDPDTELGIFRPSDGEWYVQPGPVMIEADPNQGGIAGKRYVAGFVSRFSQ